MYRFKRRSPAVSRGAFLFHTVYILEADQQVSADLNDLCIHGSVLLALAYFGWGTSPSPLHTLQATISTWNEFPVDLSQLVALSVMKRLPLPQRPFCSRADNFPVAHATCLYPVHRLGIPWQI